MMLPRVWGRKMAADPKDPLVPELWDLECPAHGDRQGPMIRVMGRERKR